MQGRPSERYDAVTLMPSISVDGSRWDNPGMLAAREAVEEYGHKSVITTVEEDIWDLAGDYTFLTTASPLRVKAGGNVNDASAGTGARSIRIVGLDHTWDVLTEDVLLNGASASAPTTKQFLRVRSVTVLTVGIARAANAGRINVESTVGLIVVASIIAGEGITHMGIVSVPRNAFMLVDSVGIYVDTKQPMNVHLHIIENADLASSPQRHELVYAGVTQNLIRAFNPPIQVPAKTDAVFRGQVIASTGTVFLHISARIEPFG